MSKTAKQQPSDVSIVPDGEFIVKFRARRPLQIQGGVIDFKDLIEAARDYIEIPDDVLVRVDDECYVAVAVAKEPKEEPFSLEAIKQRIAERERELAAHRPNFMTDEEVIAAAKEWERERCCGVGRSELFSREAGAT